MFLHRPGASRELAIDSVTLDHGQEFTYFHFANPFALPNLRRQTADVMRMAKEAGLTTSIDTGWDSQNRWLEDLGPALPFTDMLFVNDSEARMLGSVEDLDTCANNLQALGVKDIVIKTGPGGCILYTRELRTEVPGFEAQAIDTTGAGDCFAGGFLAGMHRGWTYADSARLANAVGAMNVESLGAATGIRSFEETCAWIEARANLIG
jgi:sugar/nucleoside kinase (ribokinase family)